MFRIDHIHQTLADGEPVGRSSKLTRREVLALPVAATFLTGSGAVLSSSAPRLQTSGPIALVFFAGRTWDFALGDFGPNTNVEMVEAGRSCRLEISNARLAGIPTGTLTFEFGQSDGSIRLIAGRLGLRSTSTPFSTFLDGEIALQGPGRRRIVRDLLRSFGWRPMGEARLSLKPSGVWRLISEEGFANQHYRSQEATFHNFAPGAAPFANWFEKSQRGWAGGMRTYGPSPLASSRSFANAASSIKIYSGNLAEAVSVRFNNGRAYVAATGDWTVDLRDGRRGWQGIKTASGTLMEARDRGSTKIAARLPISPVPHQVTMPDSSANIIGILPHHAVLATFAGRSGDGCSFKSGINSIPVPVPGSDFSEVVFDGEQEYCSAYSEHDRSPDSIITEVLSWGLWGRWYVPMVNAHLRVVRGRDLVSLKFRFDGVALVRRSRGWRLEPLDQDKPDAPAAMAVEFPGQHIMEEAFFYQEPDTKKTHVIPLPFGPGLRREVPDPHWMASAQVVPLDVDRVTIDKEDEVREKRDPDYSAAQNNTLPTVPGYITPAIPFPPVAEARLSGTSRLAFKLPPATGRRKHFPVPLTLAGLTDWVGMELAVAPPARTFFAEVTENGSAISITDDSAWREGQRKLSPLTDPYLIADAHIANPGTTISTRLKEVSSQAITDASAHPFVTMIELPARLWISPDQTALFAVDSAVLPGSLWGDRAYPLWQARLSTERPINGGSERLRTPAAVRAVGSPDFKPWYFRTSDNPNPLPLPQNQATGWGATLRTPLSIRDRHELVALSALHGLPIMPRLTDESRRSSTSDEADKLPGSGVTGVISANDRKHDNSADVRERWLLQEFSPENQGVYAAPAMPVRDLRLSALGGFLDIQGKFEPPAPPYNPDLPSGEPNPFDALTIESWNQATTIGRDSFVEVVYKGFLFPIGHRAALVKRSERRFFHQPGRGFVAYLVQRYFIRINNPHKEFPAINQPNESREYPTSGLTFTKTQTPDLRDPTAEEGRQDPNFLTYNGGKVVLGRGQRGEVFWPRTADGLGNEYHFEFELENQSGVVTMPLMFLDNTAAHDRQTVEMAIRYYRTLHPEFGLSHDLTLAIHGGAMRTYAPGANVKVTSFATSAWVMDVEGRGDTSGSERFAMNPAMEGKDQPPFYPRILRSHVDIANVQRFSGRGDREAVISFDPLYAKNGFRQPNPSELFLAVHGLSEGASAFGATAKLSPVRMEMKATGNRSGGVAQPNVTLVNISRKIGPVGGQQPAPSPSYRVVAAAARGGGAPLVALRDTPAAASAEAPKGARGGVFTGADFLPADATLLGIVPLRDVVKAAGIASAPKLVEEADGALNDIAGQITEVFAQITDTIDFWGTNDRVKQLLDSLLSQVTPLGTIGKLYPGLAAANSRLADSVEAMRPLDGSGSEIGQLNELVRSLKRYNDAIEGLVKEIEKTGKNPIPSELTRLFKLLRGNVDALIDEVVNGLFDTIQKELTAAAKELIEQVPVDEAKTWFGATFGPEAYDLLAEVTKPGPKKTFDQVLELIASSASDALLYELQGRPILQLAGKINELHEALGQASNVAALRHDVRALIQECSEIAELALDATVCQLEAQAADVVCDAANSGPFEAFVGEAKRLFGSDGLMRVVLNDVRGFETKITEAMEEIGKIEARLDINSPDLADERRAAAEALQRLRRDIGTGLDHLKQLSGSLGKEQESLGQLLDGISAGACDPVNVEQMLGAITRWVSHRAKLTAASFGMFSAMQRALDALIDLTQSNAAWPAGPLSPLAPDEALAKAAKQLANISAEVLGHIDTASGYNSQARVALADAIDTKLAAHLPEQVKQRAQVALGLIDDLAAELATARTAFSSNVSNANNALEELRGVFDSYKTVLREAEELVRAQERRVMASILGPFASVETEFRNRLIKLLQKVALPVFELLAQASEKTKSAAETIAATPGTADLEALRLVLNKDVQAMFLPATGQQGIVAQLHYDTTVLENIRGQLDARQDPDVKLMLQWVTEWRDRLTAIGDSPIAIGDYGAVPECPTETTLEMNLLGKPPAFAGTVFAVGGLVDAIAKGRLNELIDVDRLKDELLGRFVAINLPKIKLSYSFDTNLQPFAGVFKMIEDRTKFPRLEGYEKDLTLTFTSSFDVADPKAAEMEAKGVLQPFAINLFSVISLYFKPIVFEMGSGKDSSLNVEIAEVELGPAVEAIEKIQQMLGFEGTGFFIEPRFSPPGVEVGYMLDLGIVNIGAVAFIDVSLGAGVLLPFDNRPAVYSFYLGRPGTPILISAGIYGGGFYLGISSTSRQIVSFSMSFEAGAVSGFKAGALTGKGKITAGIFISRNQTSTRVSGFLVASGSAHIACFSISTCLFVGIEQKENGKMEGRATFTYGFSIGLKEWKYDVPFNKILPKNFGGTIGTQRLLTDIAREAGILSETPSITSICGPIDSGDLNEISVAVAMDQDWRAYQDYFDGEL